MRRGAPAEARARVHRRFSVTDGQTAATNKLIDRRRIVVLIIILISCSLAGCYTLLKHPKTGELAEESDFTRCSDCHASFLYPPPFMPPYDPWDPPPWWWGPVVVVGGEGGSRPIILREPVKGDDQPGITPPIGVSPPHVKQPVEPPAAPPTGGEGETIKKDVKSSDQSDGSRPIHEREPQKGSNDSQQSGSKDKK
jgi:hypothetical protein